jgi:hypothetical protein
MARLSKIKPGTIISETENDESIDATRVHVSAGPGAFLVCSCIISQ